MVPSSSFSPDNALIALVACNGCSKDSVIIRKFGKIVLCPQCIELISQKFEKLQQQTAGRSTIDITKSDLSQSPPLTTIDIMKNDLSQSPPLTTIDITKSDLSQYYCSESWINRLDDCIANCSGGMQNTSPHQSNPWSSVFLTSGQVLQSTETTPSPSESRDTDRCSAKGILCSLTFPCKKYTAPCTVSGSRRCNRGTCGECVRRKIGRPILRESISLTPGANNPSKDLSKKRDRQDDFDDNDGRRKRAATGGFQKWLIELKKLVHFTYSMEECVVGNSIGRGTSMNVFEGTCNIAGTEVKVALKRPHIAVHQKMQKKAIHRLTSVLRRELTIMERLKQSSNIVNLYGLIIDGLTPMLMVELATCSLDRYLSNARQRGRPIPWIEKLHLCCNICEGLLALHSAGVVHGDIKASNVLVFIDKNGGSTAKISDFGFSCATSSNPRRGGTPAFAAPECTRLGLATHPELLEWYHDKLQDVLRWTAKDHTATYRAQILKRRKLTIRS
ncbi:kinase-like domain-containing protein [Endogone sp. FLAS-F59071]|nr:kinase-like domain-containing protein [Endogone sp. FLAS-F59071]|eukprot:RUS17905.1 kinase-like domain-containing protein [Endogone sp. FLAS-F59071]